MVSDMHCTECAKWLHPYLDNELGTEMATFVIEHLQNCPQCKTQYENMRTLQNGLREHAPYYDIPKLQQRRVISMLSVHGNKQWLAPAISFGALAASVMLFLSMPSKQDMLIEDLISSHIRSLQEQHLIDIASSDKHTVKPWFTGKLDFSPPVYDLAEQGYPLIGGRLDYINHQNAAALSYKRNKHVINVFITPTDKTDRASTSTARRGYNIIFWRKNRMAFEAVSDLNMQELEAFSKLFAEHPKP
jgi:anti-sigma factor RsiW